MAQMQAPRVLNISLNAALSLLDKVIEPGTEIGSIYFAAIPPGLTVLMQWGDGQNPFRVYDGQSYGPFCPPLNSGLSFQTLAPVPGQIMQVVVAPAGGFPVES